MNLRSFSPVLLLAAVACHSAPKPAPCPDTQTIVLAVYREHPELHRLTVHQAMPGTTEPIVVACTWSEKLGKTSDPEDLDAMRRGKVVVIENLGELDVTVPIQASGARYAAAAGITFKTGEGADKQTLLALAHAIAKDIDARMTIAAARRK
jgi:hypothetical protein